MSAIKQIEKFQTTRNLNTQQYNWHNEAINILEEIFEARGIGLTKEQRNVFLRQMVYDIEDMAADESQDSGNLATPTIYDVVDAFADIIVFSVGAIMKLGYDPEIVLLEVSKEINSRQGMIHEGKFMKDKHQDPATLHKADFSKAKVSKSTKE